MNYKDKILFLGGVTRSLPEQSNRSRCQNFLQIQNSISLMRLFKGPSSVLPSHSCLHSSTTSHLKIVLYIGSRFCFIKGSAAQNRPSPHSKLHVRCMLKWPKWGPILKKITPDRFPLAVFCLFFFPQVPSVFPSLVRGSSIVSLV